MSVRLVLLLALATLAGTGPLAAQSPLFSDSFEPLPDALVDIGSRRPAPGSQVGMRQPVLVGASFQFGRAAQVPARLEVNGVDVTLDAEWLDGQVRYRMPLPLVAGPQMVRLRAGNAEASWSFEAIDGPQVGSILPEDTVAADANPPTIAATFADPARPIDPASVQVMLDGRVLAGVAVVMDDPRSGRLSVTPAAPLEVGDHAVTVIVANDAGARIEAPASFRVASAVTYSEVSLYPAPGAVVRDARMLWRVRAEGSHSAPVALRMPDGASWPPLSWSTAVREFPVPVTLVPGANVLEAVVVHDDGTERPVSVPVTFDAPPVVTVDTPADFESFGPIGGPGSATDLTGAVQRPIRIAGRLSRPVVSVRVNQQQAQVTADGLAFEFPVYFLHEGTNLLSVVAEDTYGRQGVAQRTVHVDQTAPLLTVESPEEGFATSAAVLSVRGIANDAVEAAQGAPEPTVRVHNRTLGSMRDAAVGNRYFRATDVPLALGVNRIEVVATDRHGNTRTRTRTVTRIAAGTARLTLLSGDGQHGAIDQLLPQPLAVLALDANGEPMAGTTVRFDVIRGSGTVSADAVPPTVGNGRIPSRSLERTTDAEGVARAFFAPGNEAGVFAHAVRASVSGMVEDVVFMAQAERGPAAFVLVNGASGSQYVQAGAQPVEALSVVVIDRDRNPLVDVPVRFLVELGDARFHEAPAGGVVGDEGRSLTVRTDKQGVASVRPTAGAGPDTVSVRAQKMDGTNAFGAADFRLMVLPAGDGPTAFAGTVLDHAGAPLAGIRVSIGRTPLATLTDAEGRFRFDDQVPAGRIDLHIDGTAVSVQRGNSVLQYPGLHFETAVVPGQVNQLPHPIYLPPINLSAAAVVGGDADVRLEVPGFEGFAMVVRAHSVTFPDGSRTGPVVVTPVHGDRLPMVPPGGFASFGAIAWTIQPTGTRFDPPIEVHLPNQVGLKPGETLPIVQWDHDLATFVPMGRGTVSESGATIVSDAGSGITKAGWGGGPPPTPPNCADNPPPSCRGGVCNGCPQCQAPQAAAGQQCPSCRPDLSQAGSQCGSNWCHRCSGNGNCGPDPVGYPTTPPAGVTEVTLPSPSVVVGFTTNKSEFHGFDTGSQPAEWDFELDAYCNPNGQWKFKLKKAEIRSKIIRPSLPGWTEFNLAQLLSHGPPAHQNLCQYHNSAEFALRWAASSHFFSGAQYDANQNPEMPLLIAQGWHHVQVPNWDTWSEVEAHERLHYRRFKRYVAQSFAALEQNIDRLALNLTNYPTKADVLASDAARNHLRNSLAAFKRDIADLQANQNGLGDHAPASDFYACSMNALAPDFGLIDNGRQAAQCPLPGRTIGSCPN